MNAATMTSTRGTPVWFELASPDPDGAQAFLEAVAGWRFGVSPVAEHGGYRMGGPSADDPVAGVIGAAAGGGGWGWTVYLASDDVDAGAVRVAALGGVVHHAPTDIPHVGRFAVVADPQGVTFALMRADRPAAAFAAGESEVHGRGMWIELATPDPAGAFAFYGDLFGWARAGGMAMGDMGEYAFIGAPGLDAAPGAIMSSTATGAPAAWNWYVQVPDIDAATATVWNRGGTVLQGPDPIPGGAYSANVADPRGCRIGLVGARGGEA